MPKLRIQRWLFARSHKTFEYMTKPLSLTNVPWQAILVPQVISSCVMIQKSSHISVYSWQFVPCDLLENIILKCDKMNNEREQ